MKTVTFDETQWKLVPVEPPESQWGCLARDIIMGWDMGCYLPREMFKHLERHGTPIPQWLRDEPEMRNLDHVPSKGTRAVILYRAMLEFAPPPPASAAPAADGDALDAERWRWATYIEENAATIHSIVLIHEGNPQKINERADFYRDDAALRARKGDAA